MMRFSCILFTIYFCRCKLYRSRSKALYVGLFRAIPSYTLLMQAEMPQIRAVHRRRVSLCLDRDSRAGIDARAGNYAPESKRLLESDCSTLSLNRALRDPLLRQAEMPQIRVAAVSRVNIRLGYDRLVCPKRSSPWQSIGGDSRMRPLSNSAECPDVMDPERGSVSSGAVVALCRTVAGRVPACKCRAERVQLRGRLVPLSGYQVRSGEVQRSSAEPGLSGAIRGLQVLLGSVDSCYPSPRSYAQLR